MPWSAHALDTFIAPKLSALKVCSAQKIPELPNYLGSLRVNQILGIGAYPEPMSVLVANFISRLAMAINEYNAGQIHLVNYVDNLEEQRFPEHRKALFSFENCILHGHIAGTCLNALSKVYGEIPALFTKGDGSPHDRLRLLNNRIKHFDEDVEEAADDSGATIPLAPIWITDTGLEGKKAALEFTELARILTDRSADAKTLSEEIFSKVVELRKLQEQGDAASQAGGTAKPDDDVDASHLRK
ncbi:hypothetical protein [Azospirillum argentinense]